MLRLVLAHIYTGRLEVKEEEVGVLAELMDVARMICNTGLQEQVEQVMKDRLENPADEKQWPFNVAEALNAGLVHHFPQIQMKALEALSLYLGYAMEVDHFCLLSFASVKLFLEYVRNHSQLQQQLGFMVTSWLQKNKVCDDDKEVLLELTGMENLSVSNLVDVMEKAKTSTNSKLIEAVKEKDRKCKLDSLELFLGTTHLKEEKENLEHDLALNKNEIDWLKAELNSANKEIQRKGANMERIRNLTDARIEIRNTKLKNLVRHVESNLKSFQLTIARNSYKSHRSHAQRCRRIMESANQALKSLKENRAGDVIMTHLDKISWSIIFEEAMVERVVKELFFSSVYLVQNYEDDHGWFFEKIEQQGERLGEAMNALAQVYQQYD